MADNFNNSIGGSKGSSGFNSNSVGIGQQAAFTPLSVSLPTSGANTGPNAVPQDGAKGAAVPMPAPASKSSGSKNATHARADGKTMPAPSKTRV